MNGFSKDAQALAAPPAPDEARLTSDLELPSAALDPVFPLHVQDTRLVIFMGAPGEVRAHWHVQSNAVISASANFPPDGGSPFPVVRLRRLSGEAGVAPFADVRLRLTGHHGEGETAFWVGPTAARFEAELGLANPAGGWLLLARSNQLEYALGIGLEFAASTDAAVRDAPLADLGEQRQNDSARAGAADGQAPDLTLVQPSTELVPTFPLPAPLVSVARLAVVPLGADSPSVAPNDGARAERTLAVLRSGGDEPPVKTETHSDDDTETVATHAAVVRQGILPLVYGQSAPRPVGLRIEAELRIDGWTAPNSEIDLFGYRYRVGPGGRFQFLLRVDDPTLLAQALALHPPPELCETRDD